MRTDEASKLPGREGEPPAAYRSEERVVCPVCGYVSRKPGAICPYCSNYMFVSSQEEEE